MRDDSNANDMIDWSHAMFNQSKFDLDAFAEYMTAGSGHRARYGRGTEESDDNASCREISISPRSERRQIVSCLGKLIILSDVKLRVSDQAFRQDVCGNVLLWVVNSRNQPVRPDVLIELSREEEGDMYQPPS